MKVLLIGKNGQIGRELCQLFSNNLAFEFIALNSSECDLKNANQIKFVIQHHLPNIIINAAAYTHVDNAEHEHKRVEAINALALKVIGEEAQKINSLVIFYSSDYVFDGKKSIAYVENDLPNPINFYGLSKLMGEKYLQESGAQYLIFRISWVFGTYGNNFIKKLFQLVKVHQSIRIVTDQWGTPTSARMIASFTEMAMTAYYANLLDSGIYHLSLAGEATRFEWACEVISALQSNSLIDSDYAIHTTTSDEFPTVAKRPLNSKLNASLLINRLKFSPPTWREEVNKVVQQLINKGEFF